MIVIDDDKMTVATYIRNMADVPEVGFYPNHKMFVAVSLISGMIYHFS